MSPRHFLALIFFLTVGYIALGEVSDDRVFDVTGTVRAALANHLIVIDHDPIPDLMPRMTMAFEVGDVAEARTLQVNDQVRFRLRVGDGTYVAESFLVTGRETVLDPKSAPPVPPSPGQRLRAGARVPALPLMDERGVPFPADMWKDRLTVVTFIFTRCPVPTFCPALALRFGEIQAAVLASQKLSKRVRLLSITLDPEFDQPPILRAYGEAVGADPRVWNFATGAPAEIAAISKAFSVYAERNGVTLDHTLTTALIDGRGTILEIWRGNGWQSPEIVAALEAGTGD